MAESIVVICPTEQVRTHAADWRDGQFVHGAHVGVACRASDCTSAIGLGEIEDVTTEDGKKAAAVAVGRMGGEKRAESMSAKRRKEIAQKAAKFRWGK